MKRRDREKANKDVRDAMKKYDVMQWELARRLNISEATVYRKLREEMPEDEKNMFLNGIKAIAGGDK